MLNSHTILTAVGFALTENKNDFLLFDHTMEVLTYTNWESKVFKTAEKTVLL